MKNIAVIVTYNRYNLLEENLKMLEKQTKKLDEIIIVDNCSSDGTMEKVDKNFKNSNLNINYHYMDKNYGGAGGFYYGVKFAKENNADFIWLMDDDGKPYNEYTFEKIYEVALKLYKENKLLFLNSFVTYNGKDLSFGFDSKFSKEKQLQQIKKDKQDNILFNKVNPFNGTLITKELVEIIGYPNKDFFISRDETDYKNRSVKAGAIVATVLDSIYYHPQSKLVYKKILGVSSQIYDDMDKEYYFIRNLSYSYKDNNKIKIWKFIILRLITIILYEDRKIKRIKQMFAAKSDAYKNKMGKRN